MSKCLLVVLACSAMHFSSPAFSEEITIPEHGALFCDKRANLPKFLKLVLDRNMSGISKMSDCTLLRAGLRADVLENEDDVFPKTQKIRILAKGHSALGFIIKVDR